ncbi:MAG TPA: FAD-dependent monooxygenase [Herpetosiphonaceae bacterium]
MKAVICGAGIAGLTLGWWLERAGWETLIVERAPGPRSAGYMIDFFGSGYDAMELMGLLPALESIHQPIPEVAYVNEAGATVASLSYEMLSRFQRGRVRNVMRGDLERVLRAALPPTVELRYGRSVEAIELRADRVEVQLTDGVRERADLLVGADGIHSRVRELAFGPEARFARYLGAQTAAYIFEDDGLRQALEGRFKMISSPGREAGLYPIAGGKIAAFFAHRAPDPALPTEPRAELERIYGGLGWLIPQALRHCGERIYYDQIAQIELPRWSQGRVALVGDACQAVSLLAGQGASMAMGGAWALARELAAAPGDVAAALERYEARVRPAILRKQAVGRRTANWIVPGRQWHIGLRTAILRLAKAPGLAWLLRPVLAAGSESVIERAALPA